ncbi:hypothetical protein [Mycolicibacterium hodleri]|uniref:hypothetical protein n=1 Tax=Mycolicibacterium hodleri TaxID=49897 RepID=UPI001476A3F6|nr:hypothetical protein [Mycolicibacterium hodleri]
MTTPAIRTICSTRTDRTTGRRWWWWWWWWRSAETRRTLSGVGGGDSGRTHLVRRPAEQRCAEHSADEQCRDTSADGDTDGVLSNTIGGCPPSPHGLVAAFYGLHSLLPQILGVVFAHVVLHIS